MENNGVYLRTQQIAINIPKYAEELWPKVEEYAAREGLPLGRAIIELAKLGLAPKRKGRKGKK